MIAAIFVCLVTLVSLVVMIGICTGGNPVGKDDE